MTAALYIGIGVLAAILAVLAWCMWEARQFRNWK